MTQSETTPPIWLRATAIVAGLFGAMTLFASGSVLFGPSPEVAGNTVPFVLWTNFVAGFAYVAAAVALWRGSPLARPMALAIAGVTALAALGFVAVLVAGTPVEPRTAAALAFRTLFWVAVALVAPRRKPA
jgi:hypothetical protein